MLNCHCHDCQRSSGAPFASGVVMPARAVEITGTPKSYSTRAASGFLATRSFCSTCGSPLFARSEVAPDFMSIRFSTLDDSDDFRPALDIWTSRAQPWVCMNQELPKFPQTPVAAGKT
jgi:hypothetical protein